VGGPEFRFQYHHHHHQTNQNYIEFFISPQLDRLSSRKQKATNPDRDAGKKGPFIYCWWGYKLVKPLWKSVWKFLKKLTIELLYNSTVLLIACM
jgi:hypothetical protein